MALQLQNKFRGKGVKDWGSIELAAVNYNAQAPYTLNYNSYAKFTGAGTTTGLSLSTKSYNKLGETIWTPSYSQANSSPLSTSTSGLVFTAAAQTLKAPVQLVKDDFDTFTFVAEGGTVGDAAQLDFIIVSGSNFYSVLCPVLTANKPTKFKFKLSAGTYGVADTTNPNYDLGVATVGLVGTGDGTIIQVSTAAGILASGSKLTPISLSGLNNDFQAVGAVLKDTICCFDALEYSVEDETEEIFCKGQLEEEQIKSRKITGTITIQKISPIIYAWGFGGGLSSQSIATTEYVTGFTDTNDTNAFTTTAGVTKVNVGAGLNILSIEIGDCVYLSPTDINLGSTNLDQNTYVYDKVTGDVVVNSSLNGQFPKIKVASTVQGTVVDMYPKFNYAKMYMRIERNGSITGNNKMILELKSVQLKAPSISVEDDGDTYEVEFTASLTKEQQATLAFIN